jgi:hypothetical protein
VVASSTHPARTAESDPTNARPAQLDEQAVQGQQQVTMQAVQAIPGPQPDPGPVGTTKKVQGSASLVPGGRRHLCPQASVGMALNTPNDCFLTELLTKRSRSKRLTPPQKDEKKVSHKEHRGHKEEKRTAHPLPFLLCALCALCGQFPFHLRLIFMRAPAARGPSPMARHRGPKWAHRATGCGTRWPGAWRRRGSPASPWSGS